MSDLHQQAKVLWPPAPLEVRYHQHQRPLPVKVVRSTGGGELSSPWQQAPPWLPTGAPQEPFDFCRHIARLLQDIARRCEVLAHVQVPRLLVGIIQARAASTHGLQARVTPLRFAGGQLTRQRRGITFQVQRFFLDDHEFLYLLTFCLPRFLEQDFDNKLITLFHELYHIHPCCNGDLRRHHGRYALHSARQKKYDARMADLARAYLAGRPDPELHAFLRLNFAQLCQRHGGVAGVVVPRPKVVPIARAK